MTCFVVILGAFGLCMLFSMWRLGASRTFVVVYAVLALLGTAFARRTCNTARYGLQKGREVHIQDQYLISKTTDWHIKVPPICSKVVGVSITACNVSGAPAVFLSGFTRGVVMRSSLSSTGAYLYVTVFCDAEKEDLFEIPRLVPISKFKRPLSRPREESWHQEPPITVDQLIVLSPPTRWPKFAPAGTEQPVILGISPYSLSDYQSSLPLIYWPDLATTLAPKNISETDSTDDDLQAGRSRFSVDGLQPGSWSPAEVEHMHLFTEPLSVNRSIWPLTFISHLVDWWSKHVRLWSAAR